MKKVMSLAAALFIAMSAGMTLARAEGGETGSDAAHTQPYGGYYSYYGSGYGYGYGYGRP